MPKINKNNRKCKAMQPQEEQSGEQPNIIVNSEESQEITEMITENLGNPTAPDQTAKIDMNVKITVDTVMSNSSQQKLSKITMVVNLVDSDDSEEEIISSVVVEEPEEAENTTVIPRSVTIVNENNSMLYPREENDTNTNRVVPQNRTHYLQEQRVFFPVPRRAQIIPKPPMFRCTVIDLEQFFHPDNLENMLRRSATIRQGWRAMERQENRRSGNLFSYFMHFLFCFGLGFMLITIIGAGTDFITSQNFWIWLMHQLSH